MRACGIDPSPSPQAPDVAAAADIIRMRVAEVAYRRAPH
jgi:hypothetical protein